MTEDEIHVRLTLSKGRLKAALVLLLLMGLAYGLRSQVINVSTSLPAPLGYYKKLTTTGKTILARDSDAVIIGKAPPGPLALGDKLAVFGGNIRSSERVIGEKGLCIMQSGAPVCKNSWYTAGTGIDRTNLEVSPGTRIAVDFSQVQHRVTKRCSPCVMQAIDQNGIPTCVKVKPTDVCPP